ncbi:hypothetical protein JCM1840_007214 [Sporobolomyces johnsonii]
MSSEADDVAQAAGSRRKSGRVRKNIQRLDPSSARARAARESGAAAPSSSDNDDDGAAAAPESDVEMDDPTEDEAEDDDDFEAPRPTARKRKSGAAGAGAGPKRQKKQTDGTATGKKKASQPRKRAKKAAAGEGGDYDEEEQQQPRGGAKAPSGKDFPIEDDNGLFNAVKSPNTALQTTAEDWLESYKENSGPAMAELVNFVLRCCGCNATVDEHQAEDENGVVETLKDIVDEFKQESNLAYPLISKSKGYKKFRSSLAQFLSKLLTAAADDILFSTPFYEHFQAWVHALSSSQIRALRHTATVIVLLSLDALTTLEVAIKKEHGQAMRAKEAEAKKGRKDKARLKDMERQVQEIHERLETVEGLEEEAYTSVFVNRYRDADYVIRAECISALGSWMKLNPDHWIDGDYLRYIGWVLSDESKEARRDSVRALFSLYQKDAYIGKLHHFTDRFKGQLVDMAMGEHDLSVRVQAIQVVRQIDAHGLLDEEQRDEVAQLVFEKERRVRNAAAELFKGVVEEEFEQRKTELKARQKTPRGSKVGGAGKKKASKEDEDELGTQLQLKIVAELLVKYGQALDGIDPSAEDADEQDGRTGADERGDGLSLSDVVDVKVHRGRVALAVEALWEGIDVLRDWDALLAYLLKDHSTVGEEGGTHKANGKGKGRKGGRRGGDDEDEEMDEEEEGGELVEAVKLTEEEETLAIELLVSCLTKVTTVSSTSKKDKEQDDEDQASISRAIIDALPRLFSKHQTFPTRMIDILSIPRLVQLDMYLDLRMLTAYETLWDDVTKQFLKHTDPDVLDQAVRTIIHFLSATNLSNTNQTKSTELEETLVSALRTAVADKDIESSTFEEDELHTLTASVARVDKLSRVRNLAPSLNDTDGGKQTSAWEILDSLVNRGRLGYKEEAAMIEHALSILRTDLIWQLQAVAVEVREADAVELGVVVALSERRQALLNRTEEFAVGNETNAAEGVKQVALGVLLDLYVVSQSITSSHIDPNARLSELRLTCSDELQARCAGYIEAEIERYAETLAEEREEEKEADEDEDEGSETEREESAASQKKRKGKKAAKGKKAPPKQDKRKKKSAATVRAENARQQVRLVGSQRFERSLSAFVRAIHHGVFDLRHCTVLLKHWGRLGAAFDDFVRLLMHDLRDEGNYGSASDAVATVVIESLQGAFETYLDSSEDTDEHLISLGRNLVQVAVVRGAQLAIVSSIPAEDHLHVHVDSLTFIVKKLAHFEETKRKEDRNKALSFFKALAHLLFGLDGKSALKVKTTLDSLLEKNGIEVSATSKTWEPIRAYQKRLITAMSKDPSIKSRAQAQTKKAKAADKGKGKAKGKQREAPAESDEEDIVSDHDHDDDEPAVAATPSRSVGRGSKRHAQGGAATGSPKRRRTDGVDRSSPPNGVGSRHPEQEREEDDVESVGLSPSQQKKKRQRRSEDDDGDEGSEEEPAAVAEEKEEEEGVEGPGDIGPTQTSEGEDMSGHASFSREGSVESTMSLSDVKKTRARH